VPPPEIPAPSAAEASAAWERVLAERVDDAGRIDFEGLRREPADLGSFVRWLCDAGPASDPESFPDREARIAYWIDAYNALAMWNVLHAGVLPEDKIRFFGFRDLCVDGRRLSLYELENDVIRPLGEPRVHFALNCMVRDCPRLPREPFAAGDLDLRLDAAAREFLSDPRRARVEDGEVLLSPILGWYEEDFLAVSPSLVEYVDRYRAEPLPSELPVRMLDYDWTLNDRPD
jgi:hypothetical protein